MRQIEKGSINKSVNVYIIDSTTGEPETGVLWNAAGMDLKYRRELSVVVPVTEATLAALTTAHTDGGFLEIGNGVYRFDLPDAAFAIGADKVLVFGTVTGMIVLPVEIQLVGFDPEDSVRLGLTALPNAAANAAGGLPVSAAGGLALDTKLANTNEITVARMGVLTDWINGGRLDVLLDAIPTTAMRGTDSAALASVCSEGRLAELDAANLPASVDAIPTTAMRGTDNAAIATQQDTINAVVDAILALLDDARGEPGQGNPPVNPDTVTKIDYLYKAWRNKKDNDGSITQIYNDAGTVVDQKQTTSEAAGTVTKDEVIAGP
jgi:hypothetical protein